MYPSKTILKTIIFILITLLVLPIQTKADTSSLDDPVDFGITRNEGDQLIPVFDEIGSKTKTALLEQDHLCALDFQKLETTHYWYHIVYLDENGDPQSGYVKENNFEQLTVSTLAQMMTDPKNAEAVQQLIALSETSPLFLHEQVSESNIPAQKGTVRKYILNTNTMKFHYPDCKSVKQMKEKNKREYNGTRQEIIEQGYAPCKNCNP